LAFPKKRISIDQKKNVRDECDDTSLHHYGDCSVLAIFYTKHCILRNSAVLSRLSLRLSDSV
jgi:hypothetical protein